MSVRASAFSPPSFSGDAARVCRSGLHGAERCDRCSVDARSGLRSVPFAGALPPHQGVHPPPAAGAPSDRHLAERARPRPRSRPKPAHGGCADRPDRRAGAALADLLIRHRLDGHDTVCRDAVERIGHADRLIRLLPRGQVAAVGVEEPRAESGRRHRDGVVDAHEEAVLGVTLLAWLLRCRREMDRVTPGGDEPVVLVRVGGQVPLEAVPGNGLVVVRLGRLPAPQAGHADRREPVADGIGPGGPDRGERRGAGGLHHAVAGPLRDDDEVVRRGLLEIA